MMAIYRHDVARSARSSIGSAVLIVSNAASDSSFVLNTQEPLTSPFVLFCNCTVLSSV